ncbi:MAG: hypothetical protein M0019_01305 [Actinomycetota bacterium]|nr:hypothetical protein [Actinomycetota bacterium]
MTLFITLTFMIFATATILTILSVGMYLEYRKVERTTATKASNYSELSHQRAKNYENSLKAIAA